MQKSSEAFVDDRKLRVVGNDYEDIGANIKSNIELIQELLATTGGGLNLHKCAWTIINRN